MPNTARVSRQHPEAGIEPHPASGGPIDREGYSNICLGTRSFDDYVPARQGGLQSASPGELRGPFGRSAFARRFGVPTSWAAFLDLRRRRGVGAPAACPHLDAACGCSHQFTIFPPRPPPATHDRANCGPRPATGEHSLLSRQSRRPLRIRGGGPARGLNRRGLASYHPA